MKLTGAYTIIYICAVLFIYGINRLALRVAESEGLIAARKRDF